MKLTISNTTAPAAAPAVASAVAPAAAPAVAPPLVGGVGEGKREGKRKGESGFTLIETIVIIIAAATLATMLFAYFGSGIYQSSTPLFTLQKTSTLQNIVENITADYEINYKTDLAGIKAAIGNENTDTSNAYGTYRVVENRYIKFVSEAETAGVEADGLLKVIIRDAAGNAVTVLYSRQ